MFENSDYMHTLVKDFVVILPCISNSLSRKIKSKSGETFLVIYQTQNLFLLLVIVILNIFKHKGMTKLIIMY
jgi:hypothetical protein